MVKRNASAQDEPEQKKFDLPSQKEHLFQVTDVYGIDNNEYNLDLGPDDTTAKLEVVGGDEEGRTMLNRMTLDDKGKGFFATRLFLKVCGLEYKGDNFPIDSDEWVGKQFYATVVHNKGFANIKEYNYEKMVEQVDTSVDPVTNSDEVEWDKD